MNENEKLCFNNKRNNLQNLLIDRKIAYLQIFILIASIFAFSYIIYESNSFGELKEKQSDKDKSFLIKFFVAWLKRSRVNLVSAEVVNCCPVLKNTSASCLDLPAANCQSQCSVACLLTRCQETASCKAGCCFNQDEGLCVRNSPKSLCEQEGGLWQDDAACNIERCKLGCCVLGSNTDFVTERRCEKLSSLNGLSLDFRKNINNELDCIALSRQQALGACIIFSGNEDSCKFLSKVECLKLQGSFHENILCTNPGLNTTCSKTQETTCKEGKDEVYFLDSCGNLANIYNSNKLNDENYWGQVVSKNSSCNPGSSNINSQSCGNCNYFLGSKCSLEGKKNICIDLNCKDAPSVVDASGNILSRKDRKNGESWCVYDSAIGQGKDVVGSRHFRYSCIDGKVQVEPCEDYRQGLCVESVVEGEGESMSFASCRPNRWRECLDYNKLAEKKDKEIDYKKVIEKCKANSDCYLKQFNFGKGYNFVQCLPQYPSGFVLQASSALETDKGSTCSQANFKCKKIEVKSMLGGWKCVAGCECDTIKYTQQMNDWCVSLGDCGAYVNIASQVTDDGYTVDKAPKIDANQYKKYANPVEGQKADPGNITELLGMIDPGNAEDYAGEGGGPIKSLPMLILAQLGKGAVGGLYGLISGSKSLAAFGNTISAGLKGTTLGLSPATIGGFASVGIGALGGSIVGTLIANMFGLKGEDAYTVGCMAGSVGGIASLASTGALGGTAQQVATLWGTLGSTGTSAVGAGIDAITAAANAAELGVGGSTVPASAATGAGAAGTPFTTVLLSGLVWAAIAAVIISLIVGPSQKPRETIVEFKCMQWQAPTGGEDCEKCNGNIDLKTCSKYRCSSLGQACELLNEGSGNELCVKGADDRIYPRIQAWEDIVSKGYKYTNVGSEGFKLVQETNECVQEFKPVLFGILTNEPAQCKLAINHTTDFESMNYYFGDSNLYSYNHSIVFNFPSVDSVVSSLGLNESDAKLARMQLIQKQNDLNFYVRCRDKNGNFNQKEYLIRTCVRSGPDVTPPAINAVSPATGSYVAFNSSSKEAVFWISEPADCKYSKEDKNYENMISNMSCYQNALDYGVAGWPCYVTFSNLTSNNNFYVRCKDQPWLDENNKSRNAMKESYIYNLKLSSSQLEIISIEPNSTIKSGVEPISITLIARTRGGTDGTAMCYYSFSSYNKMIQFFDTGSSVHKQVLSMMLAGEYTAYVKCQDEAGNEARGEQNFRLDLDTSSPKITRIYNSGNLKIFTDEQAECKYDLTRCNFVWQNASQFETSDGLEHNAVWESGLTYYIKCKDEWENSASCFVIRTYQS